MISVDGRVCLLDNCEIQEYTYNLFVLYRISNGVR